MITICSDLIRLDAGEIVLKEQDISGSIGGYWIKVNGNSNNLINNLPILEAIVCGSQVMSYALIISLLNRDECFPSHPVTWSRGFGYGVGIRRIGTVSGMSSTNVGS
jgi:hypothetical protein